MSLYERIIDIYQNNWNEWNYYNSNMTFPIDDMRAKRFIRQYFELGAKSGVIVPVIDEIDPMRSMHCRNSKGKQPKALQLFRVSFDRDTETHG